MDPDPDKARRDFRDTDRSSNDKVMAVSDAVKQYVSDGDYLASGGFGANRISTAVLHEILRQRKCDLGFAGHTTTHDFQILAAGNLDSERLLARVDAAYIVGLEARGLSPQARRVMQSGRVEVCEWTNYALACRLRAAAMGVPFLPMRSMLGTDTFLRSAATEITCPFTGKKLSAVPALYPDVAVIHVHESDPAGNCRIRGISVADVELARAAKKVIITTEKLVPTDEIRQRPEATQIAGIFVDVVCEVPFGSYPGNMAGLYFSDEEHLRLWLTIERDTDALRQFLDEYIYGLNSFEEYLSKCGGADRLEELRRIELVENDR